MQYFNNAVCTSFCVTFVK